jgi:D-aminopeptidase
MDNGSGDYVIAFSTSSEVRRRSNDTRRRITDLSNDSLGPLFQGAAEATEEAIYNSLFMATTVRSRDGTVEALPVSETLELLRARQALAAPPAAQPQ